jgi:hypothetical protein
MLLPLKTMLRLLDVALSQNPDVTFQCPVLPISRTTFYISKHHDIPSMSLLLQNSLKTIYVLCVNSQRTGPEVRPPNPRRHENMCKKSQNSPYMSSSQTLWMRTCCLAQNPEVVCRWRVISKGTLQKTCCFEITIFTAYVVVSEVQQTLIHDFGPDRTEKVRKRWEVCAW